MSNTSISNYKSKRPIVRDTDYDDADEEIYEEPYEDTYAPAYSDAYDGEERVGLFSTPARTLMVFGSLFLLVIVGVAIAWKAGEAFRPVASSTGSNVVNVGSTGAPTGAGPKVGLMAPDFTLVDVATNKQVNLASLKGEPVWLNFWGTWCPPCRAEMPEMEKLYGSVKDKVHMIGISMGPRDQPAGVAQFVKLNNYSWQFIHDSDSNVMTQYQVTGIPSSFFIDKNGVIRAIHIGGAAAPDLEANLKLAMDQQ